jgi:hypothetical protein
MDSSRTDSMTHSFCLFSLCMHSFHKLLLFHRTTYKDWMNADIRQILIETHHLPLSKETTTRFGTFPAMKPTDYFDAFKQAGFVLFSKEVNSAWGMGNCVEWSYLKLQTEFLGDSIARTSINN